MQPFFISDLGSTGVALASSMAEQNHGTTKLTMAPNAQDADFRVPDKVIVRVRARSGNLFHYWRPRNHWTPFEAACLLLSFSPGDISGSVGTAYWDYDPNDESASLQHREPDRDYGGDIHRLTELIAHVANRKSAVSPADIVSWAVNNLLLPVDSELACMFGITSIANSAIKATTPTPTAPSSDCDRRLAEAHHKIESLAKERDELRKKAKGSGKQWALIRERAYASALYLLATDRSRFLDSNGRVVASKLADAINDRRVYFGFDADNGDGSALPAHSSLREYMEKALSGPLPEDGSKPDKKPKD